MDIKLTLLLIQFLILPIVEAQSLLINPDFELYSDYPDQAGEWNLCVGWSGLHAPYASTGATPDYHHMKGEYPVKIPYGCFTAEYIPAHTGEAITGLFMYTKTTEYREYLTTKLVHSLEVGKEYEISFWISNGVPRYQVGYLTGGMSCNRIGVLLSTDSVIQYTTEVVNRTPQFLVEEDFFSETWKQYSYSFVADSSYAYLSFGNFFPDSLTNVILTDSSLASIAYVFFDDFVFEEYVDDLSNWPVVIPNVFTPNLDGFNDEFFIKDSTGFESFELQIFNRWGNLVFKTVDPYNGWDGNSRGTPCQEGSYFWKLMYRRPGGDEKSESGFLTLTR